MSFNLNERQLKELFHYFPQHYNVDVLPHHALENPLPPMGTEDVMAVIAKKVSFGDGLIISTVEKHLPGTARFVSWNASHFRGRLSVPAMTPREFLDQFA